MLDHFFMNGSIPATTESGAYKPVLVLVSFVIASLGAYVALTLATAMTHETKSKSKNILHACGAVALGSGIWAMHFIGMIAYKMNMLVSYDPLMTAISMAVAILIAYGVLAVTRYPMISIFKTALAACLLGIGIAEMHYSGMAAMRMDADLRYAPLPFFLSILIAIVTSGAALWIFFTLSGRRKNKAIYTWRAVASLVMGAAVCGMHYTGMTAAVFIPHPICRYDQSQNFNTLIAAIVAICSLIFGIALGFSFFKHERLEAVERNEKPFPVRLLVLSLVLSLSMLIWETASTYYVNKVSQQDVRQDLEVGGLIDEILYLDVVVAHALESYASGGEAKWETAYHENARKLDEAIQDLKFTSTRLSNRSNDFSQKFIELTGAIDRRADNFIVDTETKVIDLARTGQLDEAHHLLKNPEYINHRQDYVGSL